MSTYVLPEDTSNGHLGACHPAPADERGVLIEHFPICLLGDATIRPDDPEWGDGHRSVDTCPFGHPVDDPPFCEDGDGCRILGYAEDMRRGDTFAPLVVIHRDGRWLLDDGHHRLGARALNGETYTSAIVFSDDGPDDPAILYLKEFQRS